MDLLYGKLVSREFPATSSNRLIQTKDAGSNVLRNLTYRTGGDLFQDQHVGGSTYEYDYSARKRLAQVKQDGVSAGTYGYDFQGQRVWRATTGTGAMQIQYVYDEDGHLLAEHDAATGTVRKEYIWVDGMLAAMVDSTSGSAQTYYVHTGQIDEPLVLTDSTKAIVWNAYVNPYGWAHNFGSASASIDLRLPGQWLQAETNGLNQNWFRDYDPSLGRYVEADPLGIDEGQNVYGYVDGDPANSSDAIGLYEIFVGGGWDVVTKDYYQSYVKATGRKAEYLTHLNVLGIVAAINRANKCGPVNLIGHSYGATAAFNAAVLATGAGLHINNLVTIDPVGYLSNSSKGFSHRGVDNWINITAITKKPDASDLVATIGGKPPAVPTKYADQNVTINANHEEMARMFQESGARAVIDLSYSKDCQCR